MKNYSNRTPFSFFPLKDFIHNVHLKGNWEERWMWSRSMIGLAPAAWPASKPQRRHWIVPSRLAREWWCSFWLASQDDALRPRAIRELLETKDEAWGWSRSKSRPVDDSLLLLQGSDDAWEVEWRGMMKMEETERGCEWISKVGMYNLIRIVSRSCRWCGWMIGGRVGRGWLIGKWMNEWMISVSRWQSRWDRLMRMMTIDIWDGCAVRVCSHSVQSRCGWDYDIVRRGDSIRCGNGSIGSESEWGRDGNWNWMMMMMMMCGG